MNDNAESEKNHAAPVPLCNQVASLPSNAIKTLRKKVETLQECSGWDLICCEKIILNFILSAVLELC